MACSVGDHLFRGNFHNILNKIKADTLQLQRNETGNGSCNIKGTFTKSLKLQM